jgi:hypothetical protein
MMFVKALFAVVTALLIPISARAADPASDEDDIPGVGRPAGLPFSGASGVFKIAARADPTTLRAESPIVYTLTVRATGAVRHMPRRPDLRQLPGFVSRFYIDDIDDGSPPPDATTRVFVYRLRARRADVTEIPSLPFVYFNPAIRPASKGFQISFTDAIPLTLAPAEGYAPPQSLPEEVYQLGGGQAVLELDTRSDFQELAGLVLLIAVPPLVCVGWSIAWRFAYPDAARKAQQRRSRAADHALRLLRDARRAQPTQRTLGITNALTHYLRERFEVTSAEPTPGEAAVVLRGAGYSALADTAADLFRACDEARFAPVSNGLSLEKRVERFILDAELQTWASHSS